MVKSKKVSKAQAMFKKINEEQKKEKKERAAPPVVGKCQALVTYIRLGQDNFKNESYEWEFKVLSGENEGRKLKKSMSLAHVVEGDKDATAAKTYKKLEQASKDLSNIGIDELDRDTIEDMEGAVLELYLWKHKDAEEKRWPTVYFNGLVSLPEEEEEEVEEEEVDFEEPVTKAKAKAKPKKEKKPTQAELADSLSPDPEEAAADEEDDDDYEDDDYEDDDDEE